ncbi:MAG: hypothetical protein K2X45_02135, partial [Phreatobacter sp.]|nr:hypothetical protein [Phreatobacter sp.]
DLLLFGDQQTPHRSFRHCPDCGEHLTVMILYEAINQRIGRVEAMLFNSLQLRDEGFLVRLERQIPWALLALVAIVALTLGYALGTQG